MRGGRLERHGRSASGESGIIATPANPAAEAVGWRAPRTKTNRRGGGGGDRPPALLQERPPLFWIRVEITPCFTARFVFCFCLRLGSNFFVLEEGPFLEKKKESTKRVEMLFLCSNKCAGNLLDFLASPIPEKARCEYEHDPIGKSTEFADRSN
jgi:hypothetical protein